MVASSGIPTRQPGPKLLTITENPESPLVKPAPRATRFPNERCGSKVSRSFNTQAGENGAQIFSTYPGMWPSPSPVSLHRPHICCLFWPRSLRVKKKKNEWGEKIRKEKAMETLTVCQNTAAISFKTIQSDAMGVLLGFTDRKTAGTHTHTRSSVLWARHSNRHPKPVQRACAFQTVSVPLSEVIFRNRIEP